jgi:hypothetical protein
MEFRVYVRRIELDMQVMAFGEPVQFYFLHEMFYIGIIKLDSDATGQLPIIYSAFVKYRRKNGNTMKKCISSL